MSITPGIEEVEMDVFVCTCIGVSKGEAGDAYRLSYEDIIYLSNDEEASLIQAFRILGYVKKGDHLKQATTFHILVQKKLAGIKVCLSPCAGVNELAEIAFRMKPYTIHSS
jgi:hypothetical protein